MKRFNIASDSYSYKYSGQDINIMWNRQNCSISDECDDYIDRVEFCYKGIRVIEFYESKNCKWYMVVNKVCNIIDKLGEDGYRIYKQYNEYIDNIKSNYIIIKNAVYKPKQYIIPIDSLKIYNLSIDMNDGKSIDGSSNDYFDKQERDLSKQDRCDFEKTLRNLKNNLIEYIKKTGAEPKENLINKDATLKYSEILRWCNDNNFKNIFIV